MGLFEQFKRVLSCLHSSEPAEHPNSNLFDLKDEKIPAHLRTIIDTTLCRNLVQEGANADRWLESIERNPEVGARLHLALKGATLVDIGVSERWESMHRLAKLMGASKFIGIDKFWPSLGRAEARRGELSVVKSLEDAQCPALLVKGDALEFLSRRKDSSSCVSVSGIDGSVICSPTYHQELARQIERVVPKGGVAFGIVSHSLSLIATNSIESPISSEDEDPFLFSMRSGSICARTAESPNPLWDDYSPVSFDRLLIRK